MPLPAKVDLDAYSGDTWAQTFRFIDDGVALDLTGATVESWVRSTTGDTTELAVTVGPAAGEVTIAWPEGGIPMDVYAYDVEVTNAGAIRTWVRGRLRVARDVTNAPTLEVAA